MTSLVHADIFFFVTTIAVVVVGILCVIVLIYIIRILHRAHEIAAEIRSEAALLREDIREMRAMVRGEVSGWKKMAGMVRGIFSNKIKSKKSE